MVDCSLGRTSWVWLETTLLQGWKNILPSPIGLKPKSRKHLLLSCILGNAFFFFYPALITQWFSKYLWSEVPGWIQYLFDSLLVLRTFQVGMYCNIMCHDLMMSTNKRWAQERLQILINVLGFEWYSQVGRRFNGQM